MDQKLSKNQKNSTLKTRHNPTKDENLEKLRNLYLKTEEMKEISQVKNRELENQFKELQDRISSTSGFLNHIKTSMENITFSYRKDINDLEKVTEENRDEIDKQIEEIKIHIGKLHDKVPQEKPKPQTYQEAFSDVLSNFQKISQKKLA